MTLVNDVGDDGDAEVDWAIRLPIAPAVQASQLPRRCFEDCAEAGDLAQPLSQTRRTRHLLRPSQHEHPNPADQPRPTRNAPPATRPAPRPPAPHRPGEEAGAGATSLAGQPATAVTALLRTLTGRFRTRPVR